jgi:hypothetical protein
MTAAHDKDNKDCRSLMPAISTQSRPIVYTSKFISTYIETACFGRHTIQNTPTIAPHRTTKNAVSPYPVAGSQRAKQEIPQSSVSAPAVSILPHRSLKMPMIGLPRAVPTFNKPIISVACFLLRPMLSAKSESEKRSTTYPNMLTNTQASNNNTLYRRRSLVSKPNCGGLMALFRSRMKAIAMVLATKATIPVMRSAHRMPSRYIMASVPQANAAPPTPDPAALMPFDRLFFLSSHWLSTGEQGMYKKPIPAPINTPWEMCSCQIRMLKEAPRKPES